MTQDQKRGRCVAVIGSTTRARRARDALLAAAISAEVVKTDSERTGRGCSYGVAYSCYQSDNVRTVLERAGIRPRAFYEDGI